MAENVGHHEHGEPLAVAGNATTVISRNLARLLGCSGASRNRDLPRVNIDGMKMPCFTHR